MIFKNNQVLLLVVAFLVGFFFHKILKGCNIVEGASESDDLDGLPQCGPSGHIELTNSDMVDCKKKSGGEWIMRATNVDMSDKYCLDHPKHHHCVGNSYYSSYVTDRRAGKFGPCNTTECNTLIGNTSKEMVGKPADA
jgi:hypothetical protein